MEGNDPVKEMYKAAYPEDTSGKGYDAFRVKLGSDKNTRTEFYTRLHSKDLYTKSQEDFEKQLSKYEPLKKKEPTGSGSKASSSSPKSVPTAGIQSNAAPVSPDVFVNNDRQWKLTPETINQQKMTNRVYDKNAPGGSYTKSALSDKAPTMSIGEVESVEKENLAKAVGYEKPKTQAEVQEESLNKLRNERLVRGGYVVNPIERKMEQTSPEVLATLGEKGFFESLQGIDGWGILPDIIGSDKENQKTLREYTFKANAISEYSGELTEAYSALDRQIRSKMGDNVVNYIKESISSLETLIPEMEKKKADGTLTAADIQIMNNMLADVEAYTKDPLVIEQGSIARAVEVNNKYKDELLSDPKFQNARALISTAIETQKARDDEYRQSGVLGKIVMDVHSILSKTASETLVSPIRGAVIINRALGRGTPGQDVIDRYAQSITTDIKSVAPPVTKNDRAFSTRTAEVMVAGKKFQVDFGYDNSVQAVRDEQGYAAGAFEVPQVVAYVDKNLDNLKVESQNNWDTLLYSSGQVISDLGMLIAGNAVGGAALESIQIPNAIANTQRLSYLAASTAGVMGQMMPALYDEALTHYGDTTEGRKMAARYAVIVALGTGVVNNFSSVEANLAGAPGKGVWQRAIDGSPSINRLVKASAGSLGVDDLAAMRLGGMMRNVVGETIEEGFLEPMTQNIAGIVFNELTDPQKKLQTDVGMSAEEMKSTVMVTMVSTLIPGFIEANPNHKINDMQASGLMFAVQNPERYLETYAKLLDKGKIQVEGNKEEAFERMSTRVTAISKDFQKFGKLEDEDSRVVVKALFARNILADKIKETEVPALKAKYEAELLGVDELLGKVITGDQQSVEPTPPTEGTDVPAPEAIVDTPAVTPESTTPEVPDLVPVETESPDAVPVEPENIPESPDMVTLKFPDGTERKAVKIEEVKPGFFEVTTERSGREVKDVYSAKELKRLGYDPNKPVKKTVKVEAFDPGQAQKNRETGTVTIDGVTSVRQEPLEAPTGKKGKVRFANNTEEEFEYALVEADQVQPSHSGGQRNPMHFVPEAQPKNRNDKVSVAAEDSFANNPRFDELGASPNAYAGAPVVNSRGEVIQGNNRSAGLKKGYAQGKTAYKEALAAEAEKFGFTPEQVNGMKSPILVRKTKADDNKMIALGNMDVKDTETGGTNRINPVNVSRGMTPKAKQAIASLVAGSESVIDAIRENSAAILKIFGDALTPAQRQNIIKGDQLTEAGAKDIEEVVKQFLFEGADTNTSEQFEALPHSTKEGVRKSLPVILSATGKNSILPELQKAIGGLRQLTESGLSFDEWSRQTDMFVGKSPSETFSTPELAIIKALHEAKSQNEVKAFFKEYADHVNGKEGDMFTPATKGQSKKSFFGEPEKVKAEKTEPSNLSPNPPPLQEQAPTPVFPDAFVNEHSGGNKAAIKELKALMDKRVFLDNFEEVGYVVFKGTKISGPADIADLFSLYRSPHIEKVHVIYYKGDEIVHNSAWTMNHVAMAGFPDTKDIIEKANELGADGISLLHNHPSGNPVPSSADKLSTIAVNKQLQGSGIELKNHVVINHTQYSVVNPDGEHEILDFKEAKKRFRDIHVTVTGQEDVAMIAQAILDPSSEDTFVIYLNTKNEVLGYEKVDPSNMKGSIEKGKKANSAKSYVIVGNTYVPVQEVPNGLIDSMVVSGGITIQMNLKVAPERNYTKKDIIQLFEDTTEYVNEVLDPEFTGKKKKVYTTIAKAAYGMIKADQANKAADSTVIPGSLHDGLPLVWGLRVEDEVEHYKAFDRIVLADGRPISSLFPKFPKPVIESVENRIKMDGSVEAATENLKEEIANIPNIEQFDALREGKKVELEVLLQLPMDITFRPIKAPRRVFVEYKGKPDSSFLNKVRNYFAGDSRLRITDIAVVVGDQTIPFTDFESLHGAITAATGSEKTASKAFFRSGVNGMKDKSLIVFDDSVTYGLDDHLYAEGNRVVHAGDVVITTIDEAKLQNRDRGEYGPGFYVSRTEINQPYYGKIKSYFDINTAAKILNEKTFDIEDWKHNETEKSGYKYDDVLKNPEKYDYDDLLEVKSFEAAVTYDKRGMNDYARKRGFDVFEATENEIVVLNKDSVKAVEPTIVNETGLEYLRKRREEFKKLDEYTRTVRVMMAAMNSGVKTVTHYSRIIGEPLTDNMDAAWKDAKIELEKQDEPFSLFKELSWGNRVFRENLEDRLFALKKLRRELERQGITVPEIDPYVMKTLQTSKAEYEISEIRKWLGLSSNPLEKLLDKNSFFARLKKAGITFNEFSSWMYAKHAPDFNDRVREKRRAARESALDKLSTEITDLRADLAAATTKKDRDAINGKIRRRQDKEAAILNGEIPGLDIIPNGSGMLDEDAELILQQMDDAGKTATLETFAKEFRGKIIIGRMKMLLEAGIIDQETFDTITSGEKEGSLVTFENYIPLFVDPSAMTDMERRRTVEPSGLSAAKEIMGTGRFDFTQRQNPVLTAIRQYGSAIAGIKANESVKSLADLIRANPHPLWSVRKAAATVTINDEGQPEVKSMEREVDKAFNIPFMEDGDMFIIELPSVVMPNGEMAPHPIIRAYRADKSSVSEAANLVLFIARTYNNFKRAIITIANPFFGMKNLIRDVGSSLVNLSNIDTPRNQMWVYGRFMLNFGRSLVATAVNPLVPIDKKFRDRWTEALQSGMQMSWVNYDASQTAIDKLQGEIDYAERSVRGARTVGDKAKAIRDVVLAPGVGLLSIVKGFNNYMENLTRFAAYNTLRDAGLSADRAAFEAKNITVNFEKKGSSISLINAAYLFANAGIQGSARELSLLKSKRGVFVLSLLSAASYAMRLWTLSTLGDDDDDVLAQLANGEPMPTKYSKIVKDEFLNSNYFIIGNPHDPNRPLQLPKAYGLSRVFSILGEEMAMMQTGLHNPLEAGTALFDAVHGVVNPVTGNNESAMALVPFELLRPALEANFNSRWTGQPLIPFYDEAKSDVSQFTKSTDELYIKLAQRVSELTGGGDKIPGRTKPLSKKEKEIRDMYGMTSAYSEGWIDISPTTLQYLVESYVISGVFKEGFNAARAASDYAKGEGYDANKIPLVRQFYPDYTKRDDQYIQILFDLINERSPMIPLTEQEKSDFYEAYKYAKENELLGKTSLGKIKNDANKKFGL